MKEKVENIIERLNKEDGKVFLTERDVQAYIYAKLPLKYRKSDDHKDFPYALAHCELKYPRKRSKKFGYADIMLLDKNKLKKKDLNEKNYKILLKRRKGISIEIKYSDYYKSPSKNKKDFTQMKNYEEKFLPKSKKDIQKLKEWDYGFFIYVGYNPVFVKRIENDLKKSKGKKVKISCLCLKKKIKCDY